MYNAIFKVCAENDTPLAPLANAQGNTQRGTVNREDLERKAGKDVD